MNEDKKHHLKAFIRARRVWFAVLFLVSLPLTFHWANTQSNSVILILGLTLAASLIITTILSLASPPILFFLLRLKKKI